MLFRLPFVVAFLSLVFLACQDQNVSQPLLTPDVTVQPADQFEPNAPSDPELTFLPARSQLPICTATNEGAIYFVKQERLLLICHQGTYHNVLLPKAKDQLPAIKLEEVAAGHESCGDGGVKLIIYQDTNVNQTVEPSEIQQEQFLCNRQGPKGDQGEQGEPGETKVVFCQDHKIKPLKELTIVDPLVVEDERALPGGPWHAGTLLRQMLPAEATPAEITAFVLSWLETWESDVTISDSTALARPAVRDDVICPWINASFDNSNCTGNIDLDLAPFRLLSIVNRMDLGNGETSAGEGRFVFGLLDQPTRNPIAEGEPQRFSIIFEYSLPLSQKSIPEWAQSWHELNDKQCDPLLGCEDFNATLQQITSSFSRRNLDSSHPNGNPLSQIRSNEVFLSTVWELREFNLKIIGGDTVLEQVAVKQTPDRSFNNTTQLSDFAQNNIEAIATGQHIIPEAMRAASAIADFTSWQLPGASSALRDSVAKSTCDGCHNTETTTIDAFYHISPLQPAGQSRLSPFVLDEALPARSDNLAKLLTREECRL
jgi:hypothetical protein